MRSFGSSRGMGRRSVPRAQAPIVAVLSTSTGGYPAALVDISRTGCRLRGEILPQAGQKVTFTAEKAQVAAEVVWCRPGSCAVEFDTPIAVTEVQRLRSLGLWADLASSAQFKRLQHSG
jgi:hypothetical protein